jgi:hypothetical protein
LSRREDSFIESREAAKYMADDEGVERVGNRRIVMAGSSADRAETNKRYGRVPRQVKGKQPISNLIAALSGIEGVS